MSEKILRILFKAYLIIFMSIAFILLLPLLVCIERVVHFYRETETLIKGSNELFDEIKNERSKGASK